MQQTQHHSVSNTTAWLQPCDIVLLGAAKQMVRKQHTLDRQLDMQSTLKRTV